MSDDFLASSAEGQNGRIVTVDGRSWLDRVNEWKPSFVVMDIEGGEAEVLPLGIPDFVERLVIEFHPDVLGLEKQTELITFLQESGFQTSFQNRSIYAFSRIK